MGRKHKTPRSPVTDELKASRYAFLFVALMALFVVLPFIREGGASDIILESLFVLVLLSSFRALGQDRRVLVLALVLGLGLLFSPGWHLVEPSRVSALIANGAMTAIFALIGGAITVDVYQARRVSFGTLLGACSAYVLLGLFWFGVLGTIDLLQPDAFSFTDIHHGDLGRVEGSAEVTSYLMRRSQLFYFSFVTLTTLGYGDISPVSELARIYSILEAISGQLFIAILVARLVGLQLANVMTGDAANRNEGEG